MKSNIKSLTFEFQKSEHPGFGKTWLVELEDGRTGHILDSDLIAMFPSYLKQLSQDPDNEFDLLKSNVIGQLWSDEVALNNDDQDKLKVVITVDELQVENEAKSDKSGLVKIPQVEVAIAIEVAIAEAILAEEVAADEIKIP